MNLGRLLLAGLLAGLVLNIGEAVLHGVVLAEPTAAALTALGRSDASSPAGLTMLVGITFVQGIIGLWLHALLSGRGVTRGRAAVVAGLALWVLSAVYAAIYFGSGFPNVMPAYVIWLPVVWALVEFPLAIFVGALLIPPPKRGLT
ncbi:MAG TPA: hypothetical protein VM692_05670 [Gammaproteobacteria bacterium]|nr:hypothetical protein [Gammaproteobacteria bacterium]